MNWLKHISLVHETKTNNAITTGWEEKVELARLES
jgi:hypothetical protein